MTVIVTTRTYSPTTGLIVSDKSDMLSFGSIAPGSKSDVIIVDSVISGVFSAGDLGIGIASSNLSASLLSNILYYSVINSLDNVVEPTSLFSGSSGYDGLNNVINVGFRTALVSNYVALMIKSADRPINCGCLILKWFFGFDKKV